MKKHLFTQAVKVCLVSLALIAFTVNGFGMEGNAGRIIPMGKVYMIKDGQTIGSYSSEAPLPENILLKTEGDCAVKLTDLYLVAVDKSQFAISNADTSRELRVKEGTVYFALSKLPQALVFTTPEGFVTVQQVILNASTEKSTLKGYVSVSKKGSEIGVIEGGSLLISTADGDKLVTAGNRIYLAQVVPGGAAGGAAGGAGAGTFGILGATAVFPLLGPAVTDEGPGSPAAPQ
ncbi:MAG TPA: hypothetical protein ENI07_22060 [Desulfobacterales bacterium]|nr:hypothetical protein [Desulfobacterales bacterium]